MSVDDSIGITSLDDGSLGEPDEMGRWMGSKGDRDKVREFSACFLFSDSLGPGSNSSFLSIILSNTVGVELAKQRKTQAPQLCTLRKIIWYRTYILEF